MHKTFTYALLAGALVTTSVQAAELTGTMKKIKETGVVTIGYRESSIPFSYLDDKQRPIGYAIDLCNQVVGDIKKTLHMPNLQVKLNPVTSQTRIPLMTNGTVDLECGSTTNSLERQKQVSFSNSYYVTAVKILAKANAGIKSLADLDGKTVVTTTGTTSDRYIKEYMQNKNMSVKSVYGKDHAESFLMVDSDRADAFVMDDVLLAGLRANAKNPKAYAIVGEAISVEPYGIMMRKDGDQLKKVADATLTRLMKSGEATKLYNKWFTQPIPPKGINLQLPMSEELKAAFTQPTDKGI
jgi:glutamate/aspartate transport system substrate-binding protein